MSQQINLYNAAFNPPREYITAKSLAMATVVFLVVVLGGGLALRQQAAALEADLVVAQATQAQAQATFDAITQQATTQKPSPMLVASRAAQKAKWDLRETILTVADDRFSQTAKGFSPYMKGLARQHVPGVWLTGLSIATENNQLSLRGRTLRKELLPDYVQRLKEEKVFAGTNFSGINLGTSLAKQAPASQTVTVGGRGPLVATGTAVEASVAVPPSLEFQLLSAAERSSGATN